MRDKLKQLFRANAKAGKPLRVEAEDNEATIYLYDVIGEDWWGGISAQAFVKELAGVKAETVHLRINSPGGDVFEARAMQTALAQHSARVVVHIDGLAASAATFLAMAADEIEIAEGAMFMIHNAWGLTIGNKEDMLAMAEMLEKVDNSIALDYSRKSGWALDEIKALMAAETWFTAQEALDTSLVDRIYAPEQKTENKWDLSAYDNAPEPEPDIGGPDNELLAKRLRLVAA